MGKQSNMLLNLHIFLSFSVTRVIIHSINKSHLYLSLFWMLQPLSQKKKKAIINKDPITPYMILSLHLYMHALESWEMMPVKNLLRGPPLLSLHTFLFSSSTTALVYPSTTYLPKFVDKHNLIWRTKVYASITYTLVQVASINYLLPLVWHLLISTIQRIINFLIIWIIFYDTVRKLFDN